MTGIDPDKVEEQTGFRTCNIAVTNAVLAVTGNLTLDHFLAHNARIPTCCSSSFRPTASSLKITAGTTPSTPREWLNCCATATRPKPGMFYSPILRSPSPSPVTPPASPRGTASRTPGFTSPICVLRKTPSRCATGSSRHADASLEPPANPLHAWSRMPLPSASLSRAPWSPTSTMLTPERAGVVLVNVAPIPECDPNLAAYSAELDGVTSNSLLPMPIGYFNNCCHYTARGSEVVSTLIAGELNKVATRNPAVDNRVPSTHQVATTPAPSNCPKAGNRKSGTSNQYPRHFACVASPLSYNR